MKETAIEWFYKRIQSDRIFNFEAVYEQAKELEKEQIIDAHTSGYVIGGGNGDLYDCSQYYDQAFLNREEKHK